MDFLRTAVRVLGAETVNAMLSFAALLVFSRRLGASAFGVFVLFQAFTNLLSALGDLGIDEAVQKRISENPDPTRAGELFSTAVLMELLILSVASAGILSFRDSINSYLGSEIAHLLIPVMVAQRMAWVFLQAVKGEHRVDTAANFQAVRQALFLLLGVALYESGLGLRGVIYGLGASWVAVVLLSQRVLSLRPGFVTPAAFSSLLSFSKYNLFASVLRKATYSWIDVLVIGYFMTQSHVAAYEIAWRITLFVLLFSKSIGHVIFPQVSSLTADDETERIERMIPLALTASLFFIFPAIAGAATIGEAVISILFGAEYGMAAAALIVLLVGKVTEAANWVYSSVLLGFDRPDLVARSAGVFILANVLANVALVPLFGLVGAAVATSASFGIHALMNARYLEAFVRVDYNATELLLCLGSAIAMGLTVHLLHQFVVISSLVELLSVTAFAAALYGVLVALPPTFRRKSPFRDVIP